MANIKVELSHEIIDGQPVTIVAPCDCTAITGLKVYYPGGSKQFAFKDAHGNDLTGIGNLFAKGAIVKALLDVKNGFAYLQNADTNAYIENTFLKKSGGTMTGAINMGSKKITSLATPTADTDAATKKYVDDGLGKKQDSFTTLPIEQGGTGATTANGACAKILGDMTETTATLTDSSMLVFKYSNPQPSTGAVFYKKAPLLYQYIASKLTAGDLLDLVYPIGSVYIAYNSTSPASRFGGTWTQIKDRFLLGVGSTYAAAKTGGSATHTLTIDEMPNHDHKGYVCANANIDGGTGSNSVFTAEDWGQGNMLTGTTGGGKAHNNMPPYQTVYMWRRTA